MSDDLFPAFKNLLSGDKILFVFSFQKSVKIFEEEGKRSGLSRFLRGDKRSFFDGDS